MFRRTLVTLSTLALCAGLAPWTAAPATAADAVCPSLPTVTAFAQVSGVVRSGNTPVAGAAVYAINMETGATVCVLTNANGVYTAALPAVVAGGSPRKPADAWYLIANADGASSLASGWRQLQSANVTGNVTNQDLDLATKTLDAQSFLQGSETPIGGPAILCLIPERTLDPPVTCGVTQSYGGTVRAQLRAPAGAKYWIQGSYLAASGWFEGWTDDPLISSTTQSAEVLLSQVGSEPCLSGQVPVSGVVTGSSGGVTVPARAVLSVMSSWNDPVQGLRGTPLGWADSARDGTYQLCMNPSELPPDKSLATVNLFLRAEPYAGGNTAVLPLLGCASGCERQVSLAWPTVVGGKVSLGQAATPASGARFAVATVMMTPNGPEQGPEVLWGATDAKGNWGVSAPTQNSLPAGNYGLRVYPPGNSIGFGVNETIFTVPGPNVDVSLPEGNVTALVTLPNDDSSSWTWVQANKCVPKQGCDSQGAETDGNGRVTLRLSPGNWSLTAYPPWGDTDLVATSIDVVVNDAGVATPSAPTLKLRQPNVKFKVLRPNGAAVGQAWVAAAPWMGVQGNDGPWDWDSSVGADTDDTGIAGMWLDGENAVYQVRVTPPRSLAVPVLTKYIQVTGSGQNVTLRQCAAPADWRMKPCQPGDDSSVLDSVDGQWLLTFAEPNVAGIVVDPDDVAQPYANIEVARFTTDSRGNSYFQQLSGPDGWINASDSGAYAMALNQSGRYRLTVQKPWNSDDTWAPNEYFLDVSQSGSDYFVCQRVSADSACTPTRTLTDDSALTLRLKVPNVAGKVKQINGSNLDGGWMSVSQATVCQGGGTGCTRFVTGTQIDGDGSFNLSLASSDDTYLLTVYPWQVDDTSVQTTFELKVAQAENYSLDYTLNGSNVSGVVKTADDSPAADSWISVERRLGAQNWNWVGGANTNADGEFGLYLAPGQYRFRVEPGPQARAKGTSTIYPAGDDTYVTVAPSGRTSLSITLGVPNVSGNVFLPGEGNELEPAVGSWLEVQKWNEDFERYEWSTQVAGTSTGSDGGYALSVPAGRWQIVANPPWGNSEASRNELRIIVSQSGVCKDNGSGACDGSNWGAGAVDITLQSPNIVGSVVTPQDEPVGNTWVDVRRWNAALGSYEWSPDLNGLNVDNEGRFVANLADGGYELTANPPWGSSDLSRASVEIEVSASKVTSIDDSACPVSGCSDIQIRLGAPNVSGKVRVPSPDDTAVYSSNVSAEKWNDRYNYWEWSNVYTNSTGSGDYALNLTQPGSYRLTARTTDQTDSLANGHRYVVVESSDDLCVVPDDSTARNTSTCPGADDSLPNTDIRLARPNLVGLATTGGQPVSSTWVSIMAKTTFGYDWVGGTSTSNSGRFGFNLALRDDTPTEYRVEVFPPWGNADGLTRKTADVIAFTQASSVFVCPRVFWSGSACADGQTLSDDTPLALVLSSGNLKGFVRTPAAAAIRDAGVSVEKWVPAPWVPGGTYYIWQWTDQFTNTSSNGSFSLNVDDTGAYRVTAYPAWDDASGLAKSSQVVQVDASKKWCLVDDSTATAPDTFTTCTTPLSDDDSRITINLKSGNVSTIVTNPSGAPVRDAWVGVRQKVSSGGGTSWLWLSGSSSRANGSFTTFIDDSGTYALEVNPPWQGNDASLPRFTVEFTVSCTGGTCTDTLSESVQFPTPNMSGRVVSPDDSAVGVANSWVSVEQEIAPGQYEWIDLGTSTNASGQFVLNLPSDDTYRLTANPSWENPLGTRTSVVVTVTSGGVATCISGCLSGNRIQLLAANLTGKLVDGGTPMPYSWVEVRDDTGNWITGGGTDANGNFALTVPPGSYKVWGYPNWSLSQKPPKSSSVNVPGTSMPVTIDLSAVTPNFVLTLTGLSGSRLVAVDDSINNEWVPRPAFTTTTSGLSTNTAEFFLPNGTYRLTVAPDIGKTVDPGTNQKIVTIPSDTQATLTFSEVSQ